MATQKHILLVSFVPNTTIGGVGKWSHEIALALRYNGRAVDLWFDNDFPWLRTHRRTAILVFPIILAYRLIRNRKSLHAVVVHEPSGFWYGLLRRIWRSLPPMIAMSHGIESRVFRDMEHATTMGYAGVRRRSGLVARLFRFWQSDSTLRLADQVICLSSIDAQYATSKLRIPSRCITLMINGVSGRFYDSSPMAGVGRNILFVGVWTDKKGRRLLPEIWRRILYRFPDAQLRIIGTHCSKDQVERDFDPVSRASVRVVPKVESEQEMAAHYLSNRVFLMPSLHEGSPLALLEAMASGLIVVASRAGGIPNIITDRVNGLLFDSMDIQGAVECLTVAVMESELTLRIRLGAINTARRLTWTSSASALESAIENLSAVASDDELICSQ